MKYADVQNRISHIGYIHPTNAQYLYDLIIREKPKRILELGVAHGKATCVMAAALEELGTGSITGVDLEEARNVLRPSAEDMLESLHLSRFVDLHYCRNSYTWFLHDQIVVPSDSGAQRPAYDLVIIDGPKHWTTDGFAFFLVDKLLNDNGVIIFDDLYWTRAGSGGMRAGSDEVSGHELSDDELKRPHIKDIVQYLVMEHPHYPSVTVFDDTQWAVCRKVPGGQGRQVLTHEYLDKRSVLLKIVMKVFRMIRRP